MGGDRPIRAASKSDAGFQDATGVSASEASSSARPSSTVPDALAQCPSFRSKRWPGKPFSSTSMCSTDEGSSAVSVCARASASSACHCHATAAMRSTRMRTPASRAFTSSPPSPPGDTYAKPEQHERQQDKEAECHGVEAVLRQRDHAIGLAARRQVHEHIVAKQPVDDAFAECAIAAVADIGVRKEVAVADDHGALLALRGAGRQPVQREGEVERALEFTCFGVKCDGGRLVVIDAAERRPAALTRAQEGHDGPVMI